MNRARDNLSSRIPQLYFEILGRIWQCIKSQLLLRSALPYTHISSGKSYRLFHCGSIARCRFSQLPLLPCGGGWWTGEARVHRRPRRLTMTTTTTMMAAVACNHMFHGEHPACRRHHWTSYHRWLRTFELTQLFRVIFFAPNFGSRSHRKWTEFSHRRRGGSSCTRNCQPRKGFDFRSIRHCWRKSSFPTDFCELDLMKSWRPKASEEKLTRQNGRSTTGTRKCRRTVSENSIN